VSPVKYELGSYVPEDDILHSHRREKLESYTADILFIWGLDAVEGRLGSNMDEHRNLSNISK
jgi:hypothetical protein